MQSQGGLMAFYVTFIFYFFIILYIGLRAYKVTISHEDYILGRRSLKAIVTALGVAATDMSGWLMIALPGAIYAFGVSHILMPLGLLIGSYLNWHFIADRLRIFTVQANNSLTIPAYLENRFYDKSKVLRIITSVVIIIFFTIYAASGFISSGLLFSSAFNIDYHLALIMGVSILVIYTTVGGFLGVNWVDVFQGLLMFLALLILPIYIIYLLEIRDPELLTVSYLKSKYPHELAASYFDFLPQGDSMSIFITLASTLTWGLGYFGQIHILARFMASESSRSIHSAKTICMLWMFFTLLGAIVLGLVGKVFYLEHPISNSEEVFFYLVRDNVNDWLGSWFVAAVLSSVLSTAAAQLILASSSFAEDLYRHAINPSANNKTLLWVGRLAVISITLIALLFAWNRNNTVMELVSHAWAGLGASFGPVILLSLFWPRMTKQGAFCGIIIGSMTVVLWILARHLWADGADQGSILQLYEMLPGFLLNMVTIVIVSMLDNKPSPSVIKLYNRSHKICKYSDA